MHGHARLLGRTLCHLAGFLFLLPSMNAVAGTVLTASFDAGSDGFTYADDVFRQTTPPQPQPTYATGSYVATEGFSGGGLRVVVGGVDSVEVTTGMSGGWSKPFTLGTAGTVNVSLRYRLVFSKSYESGEFGEALVSIDDVLVGPGTPGVDYLERFTGADQNPPTALDSGWKQVSFNVAGLGAGTHTLRVGGYNNMKTASNEKTTIRFDDILVTSAECGAGLLFSDDFNDGNFTGWSIVNNSGTASNWSVIGGEFNQQNAVGKFALSYPTGSYAVYTAGTQLTTFNLCVDITPVTDTSSGRDTVGVMFRYKNANNYYRFIMSRRQGYSRLEKRVNGTFTTLAHDGRGFTFDTPHRIEVEAALSGRIFVYRNGEPLFAVTDTSFTSGRVALFTQNQVNFDNVVVSDVTLSPRLIGSVPVAKSIIPSDAVAVSAVARNVPSGGRVQFVLDGVPPFIDDASQPYAGTFFAVSPGDHIVTSRIVDSAGAPINDGAGLDFDINDRVGVGGEYFVAFGDSITRGDGDGDPSDNDSSDGRNIGEGYTPILNNLLSTAVFPRPVTVMSEGIGGTTSTNGLSRLSQTIARHSQSEYWLILFGTNDSGGATPLPSGVGLVPGQAGYAGSYKDKMQQIIDGLLGANPAKTPLLAKVPIVNNPSSVSRNMLIQEYNAVIGELVSANAIPVVPPDFYDYFEDHLTGSLDPQFSDELHPNGVGYQNMAALWRDAIIASGILGP